MYFGDKMETLKPERTLLCTKKVAKLPDRFSIYSCQHNLLLCYPLILRQQRR